MSRPRLTIGQSMIVVAVVAVVCALARSVLPIVFLLGWSAVNGAISWLVWWGCRSRRGVVPWVHLAILAVGVVPSAVTVYATGDQKIILWCIIWFFLTAPITLGASAAWFTTSRFKPGDAPVSVTLLILAMTYLTLIMVVPATLFATFGALVQAFSTLFQAILGNIHASRLAG